MRGRYLLVLLLAGCTASNWTKEGTTRADLDRDYDECREIAKPDPAIAAIAGAFGAVGVFVGVSSTDSRIRSCLQARGWAVREPGTSEAKASGPAATPAVSSASIISARASATVVIRYQG